MCEQGAGEQITVSVALRLQECGKNLLGKLSQPWSGLQMHIESKELEGPVLTQSLLLEVIL